MANIFCGIATCMQRNNATVIRYCRNRFEERREHRRRDSGQPRRTIEQEDRRLRLLAIRNRFSTSRSSGNVFMQYIAEYVLSN